MTAQQWLDTATFGLAPPAAERVRAEHLAHLEDALASGETEAGVVADWGDPWAARMDFREVHLTHDDALLLHPGYPRGRAGLGRLLGEWWWLFAVAGGLAALSLDLGTLLAAFWAVVLAVRLWVVHPGREAAVRVRAAQVWHPVHAVTRLMVFNLLLGGVLLALGGTAEGNSGMVGAGLLLLLLAAALAAYERRRMRRVHRVTAKLHPDGAGA